MNLTRAHLASVLAATFVTSLGCFAASSATPRVGDAAPAFTLQSQQGTNVSLGQYRGKWVVLYFYPKDQSGGCTIEALKFQMDLPKFKAVNAVILGVSTDSVASHKAFRDEDNLHFTLLADPGKKVSAEYGSLMKYGNMGEMATRNTFLIDPHGKIVKEWLDVNPLHHSKEVLAAIQAMRKS